MLLPCRKKTVLSPRIENLILASLRSYESKFGTNMVTPMLIQSIATQEIVYQVSSVPPDEFIEDMKVKTTDYVLTQLDSVVEHP